MDVMAKFAAEGTLIVSRVIWIDDNLITAKRILVACTMHFLQLFVS